MIGADVVEISRIASAIQSEHFVSRVFTQGEIAYARNKHNPAQTFAGIYAAKEAAAKLLGTGFRGFSPREIEVVYCENGEPKLIFHGGADRGINAFVSISHDGNYAFAVASMEKETCSFTLPGTSITESDLPLPPRERNTHKGDYGRVFVIGGSNEMIGAPLITAEAAVRAGAGLTTLCVPSSLLPAYQQRVKEIMLKPIRGDGRLEFDQDALDDIISRANVVVMGMGAGKTESMRDIISYIMGNFGGILICDADAINALSESPRLLFKERKCTLILTPHVGEYNRLLAGVNSLGNNYTEVHELAAAINAVIAEKSAFTVISDGIKDYNVTSGCAAMAKGGSGDALAGIIAAYACRTVAVEAVARACFVFGKCGERAAEIRGENAVTATDIINCL